MAAPKQRARSNGLAMFDAELDDLPPALRWREWMGRVEAVIFAAPETVMRAALARVVGKACNLDDLIDDIRAELKARPYDLVAVAGGWQLRTRPSFAEAVRTASGVSEFVTLSKSEELVLCAIAYFQPITRREISEIFGREIGRDLIGRLRSSGLVASGPRSPRVGAPYTYVTTQAFLVRAGVNSLRDLPNMDIMEEQGLLSKESVLSGELADVLGIGDEQGIPLDETDEAPFEFFED
jgi:segregation and condensation protein B